jgi:hypothetical protein
VEVTTRVECAGQLVTVSGHCVMVYVAVVYTVEVIIWVVLVEELLYGAVVALEEVDAVLEVWKRIPEVVEVEEFWELEVVAVIDEEDEVEEVVAGGTTQLQAEEICT